MKRILWKSIQAFLMVGMLAFAVVVQPAIAQPRAFNLIPNGSFEAGIKNGVGRIMASRTARARIAAKAPKNGYLPGAPLNIRIPIRVRGISATPIIPLPIFRPPLVFRPPLHHPWVWGNPCFSNPWIAKSEVCRLPYRFHQRPPIEGYEIHESPNRPAECNNGTATPDPDNGATTPDRDRDNGAVTPIEPAERDRDVTPSSESTESADNEDVTPTESTKPANNGDVTSSETTESDRDEITPPESAASKAHQCDGSYILNPTNNHCYGLTDVLTWPDARTAAREAGGDLVALNDEAEQTWVLETFGDRVGGGNAPSFWIGFTDIDTPGTYGWVSGEPVTFENWNTLWDEPNNHDNKDEYFTDLCAEVGFLCPEVGVWNDRPDVWPKLKGIVEIADD